MIGINLEFNVLTSEYGNPVYFYGDFNFIYIYTQVKKNTSNNTQTLCSSWRRKTQSQQASTKNSTYNFKSPMFNQKKKTCKYLNSIKELVAPHQAV